MHFLHAANVQADLADADLPPRLARRRRRRPVAVEHLDELHAAGADRRRAARLEHRHARGRRPPRNRLETRKLAGAVEEDAVEADVTSVELDRLVGIRDADADVVDTEKARHAASTVRPSRPASTRISSIRRKLSGSVTGSRGSRTSPPGWPSIFISALSWLW